MTDEQTPQKTEAKALSLAERFKIPCPKEINRDEVVLVVEDQQDMRLIIAHHLNKVGFRQVQQAQNGYEALEFLGETEKKISLIVSDIDMPVMGGLDLLQELKENPEYQRFPFALTMDNPSKEKIMFALESGVDEIIVKPFTLNDILPKMQSAFRKFHNPKNPEKVYEFAKKLYRDGKLEEAAKVYQVIANETTASARPWVGLARIRMKENKPDEALEYLKTAEERNPNFVHLYSTRGAILMKRDDSEGAIAAFKKAIELSPLNPMRYEEAAKPLFDLNRYEEGVDVLSVALKNELNFPMLHHYLSQGYFAMKDFKQAVKHIKTALAEDSENVTYLNQLGISLKELGAYDDATKVYNSIIKLDPSNKAALYNKAVLLGTQGNYDDAIKTLKRILGKFPDFKQAKDKLAEYEKQQNAA